MHKIIIILLLMCCTLSANDKWYIRGGSGINFMSLPEDEVLDIDLEMDTGLLAFMTVGHQFNQVLRSEVELGYRINEGYMIVNHAFSAPMEGNIKCYTGMMNLLLDFPFQEYFILSFGGGIGMQKTHGALKTDWLFNEQKKSPPHEREFLSRGLCIQGICGLQVIVSSKISIGGEYRFWSCHDFSQSNSLNGFMRVSF